MRISYNWLKDYIKLALPAKEIADILTNIGIEVNSIEKYSSIKGGLKGLIVGEIKEIKPHPETNKLKLTRVNIGKERLLNIICGAPNIRTGQKVVVAPVSTILYKDNEPFEIKNIKIRGVSSEGMICAEDEIGTGTSHESIIELPGHAVPGTAVKEFFNVYEDIIFEIELTPNRIDAASHFGVARELYAYLSINKKYNLRLKKPDISSFKIDNTDYPIDVKILNTNACKRYCGISIKNVIIKDSPQWLKDRLLAVGLQAINNIVDATNYVLYELGQPLHAFDADKITDAKIIVKTLPQGTKFLSLDNEEIILSDTDLMICNTKAGMCIAGVLGGIESGINKTTKNIFLECAYFDPVYIRRTSKRHGIITESSYRFERGCDPNITLFALKRAAILIKKIAGGTISSNIIDIYPKTIHNTRIKLYFNTVNTLIGNIIPKKTLIAILNALEIKILEQNSEYLFIEIPAYRVDVKREADVVEEILRIYGYNKISFSNKLNSTLSFSKKPDKHKIVNQVSDMLTGKGFNEIVTNSLVPFALYEKLMNFNRDSIVRLANPISCELDALRQTLLFGALNTIIYNINHKNPNLKLFEFGYCYFLNKPQAKDKLDNYNESFHLALSLTGQQDILSWTNKARNTSFFQLKSYVEACLLKTGLDPENCSLEEHISPIYKQAASYKYINHKLVDFGIVNFDVLKIFDIKNNVFFAEFYLDNILEIIKKQYLRYTELPRYPEVRRDLALLLSKNIKFAQIKEVAYQTEKKLLKNIILFDYYTAKELGENKKSYAICFILQDLNKTLTDKEIDNVMARLIKAFETKLGAKIR